MDIRNVQRTGDMHYVYLPTAWCKENKVSSKSKVSLEQTGDNRLIISPNFVEKEQRHLKINISEEDQDIIHKLVVSCYINPINSFEINFDKELNFTKLLNQKRMINLESVEIDKKQITCHGSISISDPNFLLKTMVQKIKNMIIVMLNSYDKGIIDRYEDEIDRSKMLIEKLIITSFTFSKTTKLKYIEMYYISLISKDLERMVDSLICISKKETDFLNKLFEIIKQLQQILDDIINLNYKHALLFIKKIKKMIDDDTKDKNKEKILHSLNSISEVITDWSITKETQKKTNNTETK
jgi:phosphate uptake regulator